MEEDGEFVYLALERCKQSLADVLRTDCALEQSFLDSSGYPTPYCMQVHVFICLHAWALAC